ncbi:O-antigen ligase family protein [Sphingomicrobium lutaoense]|uniref:O-antigen ligase n=1 Tax=Sphingomicrobium lutaoense TaxID=515949 RepID=A0A839Z416_9SPHN|nr:O-antigen ligase family protein [Sphingomicrobium lutaoense]MBB3763344.1 O-antigen ligase [Sphingomicrobium lutaoense]
MSLAPLPEAASSRQPGLVDRLAMALIAGMTAFYAWATWDHGGSQALYPMRQFAFPVLLVEAAVMALAIFRFRSLGPSVARLSRPVGAALIVTIALALFGATQAQHAPLYATVKTLINLWHLLFAFALCSLLSRDWHDHRLTFLRFLLVGLGVYLLTVIAFIATAPEGFRWHFFGMTAQNIRNLGSHLMTVAVFALACGMVFRGRWRIAAVAMLVIALSLLFWSGSRGPFLGFLAATAVGAAALGLRKGARLVALAMGAAIPAAFLSFIHVVPNSMFGLWRAVGFQSVARAVDNADISSGRLEVWLRTLDYVSVMPLWGYGDGQFFHIAKDLRPRLAFPHNVELQLLFQWGWIAGSLAILLLFLLLWKAFRSTRAAPETKLAGLLILVSLFTLGHLDGPFYDTLPMAFFALGGSIALASRHDPSSRTIVNHD